MTPTSADVAMYRTADWRWNYRYPYVFGGGHDFSYPFQPSGRDPITGRAGYDCSGIVSDVTHHGFPTIVPHPMGTQELAKVGKEGQGQYITMWIINISGVIEHVVLEFKLPEHPSRRWYAANHTGTIVGWFPEFNPVYPFAYQPRHFD